MNILPLDNQYTRGTLGLGLKTRYLDVITNVVLKSQHLWCTLSFYSIQPDRPERKLVQL